MTLDDLVKVFEKASAEAAPFPQHHEEGLYEGIRAVVLALRDEFIPRIKTYAEGLDEEGALNWFNDILGDAKEDDDYRCVQGHDLCSQMYAGPECPYCVKKEILGDAGEAVGDVFTQTEGDVHDRHFPQGVSAPQPGRSEQAGTLEGFGGTAAHGDDRKPKESRAITGADETGRSRHVGGESNHGLGREKAAGVPTREDGREAEGVSISAPVAEFSPPAAEYTLCRTCGHPYIATTAPIKFKEPSHD